METSFKPPVPETTWARRATILVFLTISIAAAFGSGSARMASLLKDAGTFYQPFLVQFRLTETFHVFYFLAFEGIVALTFAVTGLLIAWHRPVTRMTVMAAITLMLYGVTIPPPMHALVVNLPLLPLPLRIVRALGLGLFVIFLYLFPNGHFSPRWTKGLAIVIGIWSIFWPFIDLLNPYHWGGLWSFLGLGALLATGVAAQLHRYFRIADPAQQQQTKWIVYGVTASVIGDFVTHAPWEFFHLQPGSDWFLLLIHHPFFVVSQLLVPCSIAFSIMSYGLWEIDFIVNRTLLYGLLTAILTTIWATLVEMLKEVFVGFVGVGAVALAAGGAALIAALLFQPIYSRLEHLINRYVRNYTLDFSREFIELLPDVRNMISLADLSAALTARTAELVETAFSVLFLVDAAGDLQPTAAYQVDLDSLETWVLTPHLLAQLQQCQVVEPSAGNLFSILIPLSLPRQKPELLGILALGYRMSGRGYSREERLALKDLGQQAGVAVYVAQLHQHGLTELHAQLSLLKEQMSNLTSGHRPDLQAT